MTLSDQEIAEVLKETQDAPLEDSAASLIQAVEAVENPNQDNTTVLLYTPAEGRDLAAAAVVEGEAARGKPRLKRRAGLLATLLCVVGLLGVLYWLKQSENVAVETPVATVEMPAATDVEPTEGSDAQVPMAPDVEDGAPASQEEAAGDSIRGEVDKVELDEPQKESAGVVEESGGASPQ